MKLVRTQLVPFPAVEEMDSYGLMIIIMPVVVEVEATFRVMEALEVEEEVQM